MSWSGCLALLVVLVTAAPAWARDLPNPLAPGGEVTLKVGVVLDDGFDPVGPADVEQILQAARATLAEKFAFEGMRFELGPVERAEDFLGRHLAPGNACVERMRPVKLDPFGPFDVAGVQERSLKFLSRWSIDALREFFPPDQRAAVTDYQGLLRLLVDEYRRKIALIRDLRFPGTNTPLLTPQKATVRSYVSWLCAIEDQDDYDLVLTNTLLVYDLTSELYPHSIFSKCKVGGASMSSPKREAIKGRALLASSFGMFSPVPFFLEDGAAPLERSRRNEIIGTFILAHELGHALFRIPDHYDHPAQCLMTTKFETGYVSGYAELAQHPGPCPQCQPYIDAKRKFFLAESALRRTEYAQAAELYKETITLTPKHVDGHYRRYISDLATRVSRAYMLNDDPGEAMKWSSAALRLHAQNDEAVQVRDSAENLMAVRKTMVAPGAESVPVSRPLEPPPE